jgi:hypothetical protein
MINLKNSTLLTILLISPLLTKAEKAPQFDINKIFKTQTQTQSKVPKSNLLDVLTKSKTQNLQFSQDLSKPTTYTSKEIKQVMLNLDKFEYTFQIDPHIERLTQNLEKTFINNFCSSNILTLDYNKRSNTLESLFEFREGLYNLGYNKEAHNIHDMYEHLEKSDTCTKLNIK